ncbi:TonB-dependent receptor [Litorivivens sp.]|uniref:TonB-dependent receptor n=2 Tax=Litorivivens sp. TaxID=2020868 RepID=UPI0035661D2C
MTKHVAQRPQRHQTQRLYRHISSPLLALLTASSVVAQPQDNAPRRQLEEVVVTAQKRSQSLTDVPVSVTALSGDRLSDAGIENLSDLSEYAPNFKLVDSGFIPNIYMRGVGSGSNQGFELSVGIFTDGVHLGRPHQTRSAFMDLERVEVLRGPQSILFGKNAIAGALSLISAKPGDEFEFDISALKGRSDDRHEVSGAVSVPVTDSFGFRVAGRVREEEGYMYNEVLDRDEPGVDESAWRLTLAYAPNDVLDSTLKLETSTREQTGRTYEMIRDSALTRCSGEDTQKNGRRAADANEEGEIDTYNATLNVDWHLEAGTLTSVTAKTGYDSADLFDADSSSFDTLYIFGTEDYDQFSQELRFTSPTGGFMEYIAGVFYQENNLHFYEEGPLKVRTGGVQPTGVCALDTQVVVDTFLDRDFYVDTEAWSAFFQFTLNWTPTLRTTFGLRKVEEEKISSREFRIYNDEGRGSADPATLFLLDNLRINPHSLQGEREASNLLPLVNLQWDATDTMMAYVSYTEGAKSGSYDARGNNDRDEFNGGGRNYEYDDELADAWEIGAKMTLADGTADLNIALFYVEYTDMQVSVYDGSSAFNVLNAGEALTQGLEMDGRWLVTDWFQLTGSVAYLDFEWTEYDNGPCYVGRSDSNPDGSCSLTGMENIQTPEWTASVSTNFTFPLPGNLLVGITLDANYKDDHFTSSDLDPRGFQEATTRYNGRAQIGADDGTWNIALVGKNLSDETTIGASAATLLDVGGYRATIEPARTVYLEGRYRY